MGKRLGDADRPAARVGAFGRAVLDARDDGHRPQPRAQRRVGARASPSRRGNERFAYDSLPPLRADVRQDRARRPRRALRGGAARPRRGEGRDRRHRADRRRPRAGSSRRSRRSCARRRASSSRPTRSSSCATRSRPCSGRGTASARATTASIERHRRRSRHRGERADDGVRQQGRRLRHRRRVHAQPVDRRAQALRRLPGERAGRRRRRRHPHHRAARRDEQRLPRAAQAAARRDAARSRTTTTTCATSSSRSSRVACSCCRRASASAPRPPRCAWPSRWSTRA